MTDDLVKRLRENDFFREDTLYWEVDTGKADALCNQAADRIEALSAEVEQLKALLIESEVNSMAMQTIAETALALGAKP